MTVNQPMGSITEYVTLMSRHLTVNLPWPLEYKRLNVVVMMYNTLAMVYVAFKRLFTKLC